MTDLTNSLRSLSSEATPGSYKDELIAELNDYLFTRYYKVPITNSLTMEIESILMQWSQFHCNTVRSSEYEINYDQPYPRVLLK